MFLKADDSKMSIILQLHAEGHSLRGVSPPNTAPYGQSSRRRKEHVFPSVRCRRLASQLTRRPSGISHLHPTSQNFKIFKMAMHYLHPNLGINECADLSSQRRQACWENMAMQFCFMEHHKHSDRESTLREARRREEEERPLEGAGCRLWGPSKWHGDEAGCPQPTRSRAATCPRGVCCNCASTG